MVTETTAGECTCDPDTYEPHAPWCGVGQPVLTKAEQRELDDLLARGYKHIDDAPRGIRVGARVRHRGEQYRAAYRDGTGVVVAVLEKSPSSWVQAGWGKRDIELIVRTDRDRLDTGCFIGRWADYHTDVVVPDSVVDSARSEGLS